VIFNAQAAIGAIYKSDPNLSRNIDVEAEYFYLGGANVQLEVGDKAAYTVALDLVMWNVTITPAGYWLIASTKKLFGANVVGGGNAPLGWHNEFPTFLKKLSARVRLPRSGEIYGIGVVARLSAIAPASFIDARASLNCTVRSIKVCQWS
jgi:hypothetical protein